MPEHKEPIWSHLRWSDHAEILLVAQGAKEDFEDVDASDVDLTFYVEPGMLDKLAAHIKSCGESLISGPQKRPWNARELMIADPDGYRLTFSEVLKETAP
ncbi:MAG TPA: hypothetical protein PKV71_01770 [Calditrichia bacterium]|nr:hypothetical protein [Calditrichia bacterium]